MVEIAACPFCAEFVPPHARQCRHCGESLGPPTRESVLEDRTDVDRRLSGQVDDFALAYLRGAELSGAFLGGVDLFATHLVAADLKGADLGAANLCYADLSRADLRGANLFGADLSDADLAGADLRGADLREADLGGAVYDDYTLWPEGYDPGLAGAVRSIP